MRVSGGYLDLQINGGWGHHFSEDPHTIWAVAEQLPSRGVTAFLPTLISEGFDRVDEAVAVLAAGPPPGWVGAVPLGLHLEGPFLHPDRVGAHRLTSLRPPTPDALVGLRSDRDIVMVTIAPELPGALDAIEQLANQGVVVSLGHSTASLGTAKRAAERGATVGTHLFNAMSGLHHREPGLAAALLTDERLTFGVIADGRHVAPSMVDLAWKAAGDRLVLVSDAVAALGVSDDPVAMTSDGTLAGATQSIDAGVRNLVEMTGCTLQEAAAAASSRPARVIGHRPPDDVWIEIDDDGHVLRTSLGSGCVIDLRSSS